MVDAILPTEAFRRGSAYVNGKRPSVSWTLSSEQKARGDEAKGGGGAAAEDGGPSKKDDKKENEKAAGNDLKDIGVFYGGSLFINAIVGPGIFGTPKGVIAGVGSVGMAMIIWTFTGIFSMCAALCFAELRESVRREGVEYAYITEAFGPLAGFVYSWMRIAAAEPVSTAVFALAFSDYVTDSIYDHCGPPKEQVIFIATLAVLSMALINVMSTKLAERFQNLAIVGKTSALIVIIIMGAIRLGQGKLDVINEGFSGTKWSRNGLAFACYNGLWSYGGWANVNHVTSGIKKPPRNVPRVVKTVLPLVLILYICVMLSYFTAMTRAELMSSRAIGWTWAERVLGPARYIISIGVCLTALGSLNATFLTAGRLSGVAARNGQMPDVASWVHVRSKTPIVTVVTRVVIATLVICLANGQELLRFYIFCVWLFHGMSILALLMLRYKNKHKKRPYKVDLWIPIVVVLGICYILLAPFLQEPDPEFIAALVLIALSLLCYHPIEWIKAKRVISVPDKVTDKITIWMQLFLRVAPKRDLRRERRSIMRRMSILARDSIIITPDMKSPAMMRRFSRRMSRISHFDGSPALIRRLADDTQLRRRVNRGSSMAEADIKRGRSNSMWAFGASSKPSPALIRKKPDRGSRSFNQADFARLASPPSLPILKNRFNTTPASTEGTEPGALAPPTFLSANSSLHPGVRPIPSPIPEELAGGMSPGNLTPTKSRSLSPSSSDTGQDNLQVVADFESDGGGEYEVLAHPLDAQRIAAIEQQAIAEDDDPYSSSGSDSDSESSSKSKSSNDFRHTFFTSLFGLKEDSSSSSGSDSSSNDDDEGDEFEYPTLPIFYQSDYELDSNNEDDVVHHSQDGDDDRVHEKHGTVAHCYVNEAFDNYETVGDTVNKPSIEEAEAGVIPGQQHEEYEPSGRHKRKKKDKKQQQPHQQQQQQQQKHKTKHYGQQRHTVSEGRPRSFSCT